MPLSEDEQRILAEIEEKLYESDPRAGPGGQLDHPVLACVPEPQVGGGGFLRGCRGP